MTEWLRGGEIAWMQKVTKSDPSAYNRNPPNLSKEWWRTFICQVSVAGFILRSVKSAAFGANIQGVYALLEPTSKGRDAITNEGVILLPECANLQSFATNTRAKTNPKHRIGKGKHLLPILKRLINDEENWLRLTPNNKKRYLFPGWHDSKVSNAFYYTDDVTKLPQCSGEHHLWQDIQFGKATTSKNTMSVEINGSLNYWMAKSNGVKKCTECDKYLC